MSRSITLARIAELVSGEVRGEASLVLTGVASIHDATAKDVTWASHRRYRELLAKSDAGAVLVDRSFGPTPIPAVVCDNVDHALAIVLGAFAPPVSGPVAGVHVTACVDESAWLGDNVAIGPGVVIEADARIGNNAILHAGVFVGPDSTIGDDCRLWNNVVVRERCRIGHRVTIHPNVVIGADGFGYYFHDDGHRKIPHLGGVVIHDDVEIGACSCIDRSKSGDTVIGPGTKIDNMVQVAHNVEVGANVLLCAQVGVAGSARLGSHVVLGGQVGIRDNIVLGDGVMVGACSCVPQDVAAGGKVAGLPAVDARQFLRENASLRKLPELVAQVKQLAKRVKELETAANDMSDG